MILHMMDALLMDRLEQRPRQIEVPAPQRKLVKGNRESNQALPVSRQHQVYVRSNATHGVAGLGDWDREGGLQVMQERVLGRGLRE